MAYVKMLLLCYQTFDGIRKGNTFYGATIGRYGNRIAKGTYYGATFEMVKHTRWQ